MATSSGWEVTEWYPFTNLPEPKGLNTVTKMSCSLQNLMRSISVIRGFVWNRVTAGIRDRLTVIRKERVALDLENGWLDASHA